MRELVGSGFKMKVAKGLGEHRLVINSVGEGAVWVSNINGNFIENGDYICSSSGGYVTRW